ncbi:MAG: hypothetical protein ACREVK_05165 [Gammaproteobacteria bacterium]
MFVLPIERCQEASAAFNAFTKDVSQLTQHMWEEVGKQHFEYLRLCQHCGERQLRVLGNGFSWKELALEQSQIANGFWRQSHNQWQELFDSLTETSAQLRASVNRIEPFWTPAAWEEAREKAAQAVDAARDEALEHITEATEAVEPVEPAAAEQPRSKRPRRRRAAEAKDEAACQVN